MSIKRSYWMSNAGFESGKQAAIAFVRAFVVGLTKIVAMLTVLLICLQLLYGIGWLFVGLCPNLLKFPTPETGWMLASDVSGLMFAAGVIPLASIAISILVIVAVASFGGWRTTRPQTKEEHASE